jgi:tetratricopeptide (TPR) repeat protein
VLLRQADGLTLLVTSRELLRIQGEEPYALPPLADEEGIALFCERSKLEPSPTIAHIATRLEGLPLALELAAARTRILTPAQLLERLSSRLDLLTGGRDADPRQQTLRATIEWSYDLLSPAEQELFARLSVFQGGCTLGAAEEVAHADLDALQSLVDKSLLRFTDERFWMLETLREFAEEKLEEAGDADGTRERHLAHFVAVAQRAEPELKRANQTRFLDELAADHGNFRAALEHGLHGSGSADLSARLAVALTEFWDIRCYFTDSSAWFAAVLEQRDGVPLAVRASALHGAGLAAHRQGDHARAIELYAASLEAHETTRDLAGQARTLGSLAYAYMWLEQVGEAVHHAERSVAIAEASGDPWITACALAALGGARVEEGNESGAEALYEESRRLFAEVGDARNEAIEQLNLGCLAIAKGAYERADSLLADSASAARVYGDTSQASYALMHRAEVALRLGSYRDACGELREAMLLGGTSLNVVPRCLIGVALLANSAGDDERVLRLVGAVGALVDESQLESTADHFWKPSLFELRRQLDGERLDKATDHWRLVPLQDAVDEALDALLHLEPVVANQVPA